MMLLAQVNSATTPGETLIGVLGILALIGGAVWAIVRSLSKQPPSPDPWDEQTAKEVAAPDCIPLCHHCLEPHDPSDDFCPNCGAPVGAYTNFLPFPQLFSIGHVLRVGTTEHFKKSPLLIAGFFLFSLIEYVVFAPVYWIKLLLHLGEISRPVASQPPGPDAPSSDRV